MKSLQSGASEAPENRPHTSGRAYKHTKNKLPNAPDKYRDDYQAKKKKAASEANKVGGELRTMDQIHQLRVQNERKKKKNARPSKKPLKKR